MIKSIIHAQVVLLGSTRLVSLSSSVSGRTVLKMELKLTESIIKSVFGCSRWDTDE